MTRSWGRGTTPVQAALMGRKPIGNDVNPLSILLTRPRLVPPTLGAVLKRLNEVPWGTGTVEREDLLAFYHPETLRRLCALRHWLLDHAPVSHAEPDPVVDWIRMVALNRLTGHSPGFFSVYTLPPNQAVSVERQRKINAKRGQVPPLPQVKNTAWTITPIDRFILAALEERGLTPARTPAPACRSGNAPGCRTEPPPPGSRA